MMEILKYLSVSTFVIQEAFFFLLLIFTVVMLLKSIFSMVNSIYSNKGENSSTPKLGVSAKDIDVSKLKPITCPSCGGGIPLDETKMICPSCGTEVPIPAGYADIGKLRKEISNNLNEAGKYWKRANLLASNWIRIPLWLLTLWLIVSFGIMFYLSETGKFEPFESYLNMNDNASAFFLIGIFTDIVWVIILIFLSSTIVANARRLFPTLESTENIGVEENSQCLQCGGTIHFDKNDLAGVCGYCGINIFRGKFAWKVTEATKNVKKQSDFSLLEAKQAVDDLISGYIYVPVSVVILFVLGFGYLFLKSNY